MSIKWQIAQKAERKWWQNYLKNKNVHEYLDWKKKYWSGILEIVSKYAPVKNSDAILDAGCGPAGIFILFDQQNTTAFDPLLDKYETDLPHFEKTMYPNIKFVVADVENFSDKLQYDVIFCMNAINHVHNIEKGYKNLIQHLKPNGHLIVSIDAHNFSFFKYLFRALPGDILHPCQYSLNEYENFIAENNCEIIHTEKLKHEFLFDHYLQIGKKK